MFENYPDLELRKGFDVGIYIQDPVTNAFTKVGFASTLVFSQYIDKSYGWSLEQGELDPKVYEDWSPKWISEPGELYSKLQDWSQSWGLAQFQLRFSYPDIDSLVSKGVLVNCKVSSVQFKDPNIIVRWEGFADELR
jgi:hypothetical protein